MAPGGRAPGTGREEITRRGASSAAGATGAAAAAGATGCGSAVPAGVMQAGATATRPAGARRADLSGLLDGGARLDGRTTAAGAAVGSATGATGPGTAGAAGALGATAAAAASVAGVATGAAATDSAAGTSIGGATGATLAGLDGTGESPSPFFAPFFGFSGSGPVLETILPLDLATDAVGLRVLDGGRVALDADPERNAQVEGLFVGEVELPGELVEPDLGGQGERCPCVGCRGWCACGRTSEVGRESPLSSHVWGPRLGVAHQWRISRSSMAGRWLVDGWSMTGGWLVDGWVDG